MLKILYNTIVVLSSSIFVAMFIGSIRYKKRNSIPLKIALVYTIIASVFGIITSIQGAKGINNLTLINIYSIVEYTIILMMYYYTFNTRKPIKLTALSLSILLVIPFFVLSFFNDYSSFSNLTKVICASVLVIISVGHLISEISKQEDHTNKPLKFISIGVFMHFSSSFLVFLIGSHNPNITPIQMHWIYVIHAFFYMLFSLTLIIAFLQCKIPSDLSK